MADRLYFSCWLKDSNPLALSHQFEKMLARFPYSKLAKRGPVVRVYAVGYTEAPVLEREFLPDAPPSELLEAAAEFLGTDCSCEIDAYWDLWRMIDGDWKLAPSPVTLHLFGPEFDNDLGDQLRIEFGPDAQFIPNPEIQGSIRLHQSNLKSLLHLVAELERGLNLEKRQVWSESGANFAEVLKHALASQSVN